MPEDSMRIGDAVKRELYSFGDRDDVPPVSFVNIRNGFDKYKSDFNFWEPAFIFSFKNGTKTMKNIFALG
jgi:hypothetical protein